jgi:hypothetical protein
MAHVLSEALFAPRVSLSLDVLATTPPEGVSDLLLKKKKLSTAELLELVVKDRDETVKSFSRFWGGPKSAFALITELEYLCSAHEINYTPILASSEAWLEKLPKEIYPEIADEIYTLNGAANKKIIGVICCPNHQTLGELRDSTHESIYLDNEVYTWCQILVKLQKKLTI